MNPKTLSESTNANARDEVLKRMLKMKPKPHKEEPRKLPKTKAPREKKRAVDSKEL